MHFGAPEWTAGSNRARRSRSYGGGVDRPQRTSHAITAVRVPDPLAIIHWNELRLTFDETRQIAPSRKTVDEASLRGVPRRGGRSAGMSTEHRPITDRSAGTPP